ncbi:MAG: hypothetical protein AAFO69_07240 [Bacteroidota bacterium]
MTENSDNNIVVDNPVVLAQGTHEYGSVTIKPGGILTCNGEVVIKADAFTIEEGGLVVVNDQTTINATTFTKTNAKTTND